DNNHLQFPFFLYKDTTYFPLTSEMAEIVGVKAELDFESRTLKLLKTEPTLMNISDGWKKNERKDVITEEISDVQVLAYELEPQSLGEILKDAGILKNDETTDADTDAEANAAAEADAAVEDQADVNAEAIIEIPELSVREIDLAGLPVLIKEKIVYLPIKALTGENGLGWDVYFDPYTGIYISTEEGTPASSYWNKAQSSYNRGLVNYIMRYNGGYTENKAQELVFLFRNAARTYNIDEKILMAVAQKESTFNSNSRSSSGAYGMMQVMDSTGARYGLGPEQLLDAETSINFGAMYLSERIAAYGGDMIKGFSAYNQGSVSVNRGTHSTRYASKVVELKNNIDTFLTSNGFGLGN
ncbi:MAG TPA: lytic transglycosylase domain-containing protein, partial [Anaerovoracaceae bacterium]|nr:lytic transglycosylase domain-containing protein [Anaerovoracaceae bacterium]